MFLGFLEWWIGAIVWLVANVVYADMKRKGVRGFTRFAAFWVGTPTTWITLFALPEAKQPTFHRVDDDDELVLLDEIRRDRMLRGDTGEDPAEGEGARTH